jgi:hypothetical protein
LHDFSITCIYINLIIKEWKQAENTGIKSASNKVIQTMLYADDQIIMDKFENELNGRTTN